MIGIVLALPLLCIQARPNIIYIMADDLGYGEVGCFGQKKIPTPNIDRLAKEGMMLTRAYTASPVCAPTRCSLLTGKHQGHAAIRGNKEKGGFGPNDPEGQYPLPKSETTVAETLRSAGYRTALVGKWGLGGPEPDEHPMAHGFDRFYGYICQRRAHNYYPPYLWNDHQVDLMPGNRVFDAHQKIAAPLATREEYEQKFGGGDFSPEKLMNAAVQFISSQRGEPFFLYYAPILPHAALQAPREWVDRFPEDWDPKPYLGQDGYLPNPRPHATYAAMIAYLDYTVGEIMKAVEAQGKTDNTLIIFTSDNGATFNGGVDTRFFNSNSVYRAGKMSLYEGGIRVPFVARWPGHIPADTDSNEAVVCYDAMATLCEAAGISAPKNDGRSYLPILEGKQVPKREFIYFEYPEAASMQAILYGDYKVIRPQLKVKPDQFEVYDLKNDPGELHDISTTRLDLVKRAVVDFKRLHLPNSVFPLPGIDKDPHE